MRQLPSIATHDPTYRRLRYVRYADDFGLAFTGPKAAAEEIKRQLSIFLERGTGSHSFAGRDTDYAREEGCGQVPGIRNHDVAQRYETKPHQRRGETPQYQRQNGITRPTSGSLGKM